MPNRRPLGDSSGRNLDQEADALAHRIRSALAEEGEDFDQLPSLNTGSESWCGLNFDEWFKLAIRVRVFFCNQVQSSFAVIISTHVL